MPKRKKKKEYVVDSHALLTYFQEGEGWQEVGRLLRFWKRKGVLARLSWINWGEIYYTTYRYFGKQKAQEAMDFVAAYPIILEPIDFSLVELAAEYKAKYSFAYADAFCAATAMKYNADLVTGDPEFHLVEQIISIRWIK